MFFWLGVFIFTLIIELSTAELVAIWFTGGALVSLILSCFNANWVIQVVVFVLVALILLICTRPFLKKRVFNDEAVLTNVDSMINSCILITKEVSLNNVGEGKYRDVIWTCKVESDVVIEKGEFALIKKVEGNKLIVCKKEDM